MERFSSTGTAVSSREFSLSVRSHTPELESEAGDSRLPISMDSDDDNYEDHRVSSDGSITGDEGDNEELDLEFGVAVSRVRWSYAAAQRYSFKFRKVSPFYCRTCSMSFEFESRRGRHEQRSR
jgi:hypothetical protein